jgi:cytochrome P450
VLFQRRRAVLNDDPFSHTEMMVAKFGNYYYTSFGPLVCLHISDPSLIEGVLKTNARAYHKSSLAQSILAALLGYENILLAEGEKHMRYRRLVGSVFQHQNINSMISLMVDRTSTYLTKWKTAMGNTSQPLTIDIHEEMTNLILDIVTGCVFGTGTLRDQHVHEIISQSVTIGVKEMEKRMFNMVAITPILNQLPLPGKRRIDQSKHDIHKIVQHIIDQRRNGLSKSACKG